MSEKRVVRTEAAPAPFQGAPYSQAIRANGFVFVSGQLALRPDHAEIVGEGITEQTEQVLSNLEAVLFASRSGLGLVTKTTVFLADIGDFAAMNEVYARRFGTHRPARSTIQAGALPRKSRVEIECVARVTS